MSSLAESLRGTTIHLLTTYAQRYIDLHWKQFWDRNVPELERIFEKGGDSAYGVFCLKLFKPLAAELADAGLEPRPVFPGAFPQSEEHWGPWEDRERRFWSVIHQENGRPLGTLVTRIYHDHTRLRLPRPPQIYSLGETDAVRITHAIVHGNPPDRDFALEEGNGGDA